jgi:hypothetical protein
MLTNAGLIKLGLDRPKLEEAVEKQYRGDAASVFNDQERIDGDAKRQNEHKCDNYCRIYS